MSDTLFTSISNTEWSNVSGDALAGLLTNAADHDIRIMEASSSPNAQVTTGHTLNPGAFIQFNLTGRQKIFARGIRGNSVVVVTPGNGLINAPYSSDPYFDIASSKIPEQTVEHIVGRNPDIDTATDPEDVWNAGGLWVPPTAARIHNIVSTSASDVGLLVSSGTVDAATPTSVRDDSASFIADGVSAGDIIIDTTSHTHTVIQSVAATILTTLIANDGSAFNPGDNYWVVKATSTGASVVKLHVLLDDFTAIEEFVVLNGTTPVPTVNAITRINDLHIDGAASRATNVGTITATAVTDATVTAQINPGEGHHLSAIYTIPSNKTGYIKRLYASLNRQGGAGAAMADLSIWITPYARFGATGSRIVGYAGIAVIGTSRPSDIMPIPIRIPQETDIIVRCESVTDNNTDITAGFDLVLVDN